MSTASTRHARDRRTLDERPADGPGKIVATRIEATWGRATMTVRLIDGSQIEAISWCVDELTFTPADAIGRTVDELRTLHHRRDVEYLQAVRRKE